MVLTVQYKYSELETPKGCRKPRWVEYDGKTEVSVKEMLMDLPNRHTALRIHEDFPPQQPDWDGVWNYLWIDGNLWCDWAKGHAVGDPYSHLGQIGHDPRCTWWESFHKNKSDAQQKTEIQEYYDQFMVLNGRTYKRVSEPMLKVQTFGFGGNRGGTALFLDFSNYTLPPSFHFRLDELDKAIACAEKTARERGDDKSLPIQIPKFEILIPEAIQKVSRHSISLGVVQENDLAFESSDMFPYVTTTPVAMASPSLIELSGWGVVHRNQEDDTTRFYMRGDSGKLVVEEIDKITQKYKEALDKLHEQYMNEVARCAPAIRNFAPYSSLM